MTGATWSRPLSSNHSMVAEFSPQPRMRVDRRKSPSFHSSYPFVVAPRGGHGLGCRVFRLLHCLRDGLGQDSLGRIASGDIANNVVCCPASRQIKVD